MAQHPRRLPFVLAALAAAMLTSPASAQPAATTHVVTKGNTLFNVAKTYGVSVADLKRLNGIKGEAIQLGQRLRIPGSFEPMVAEEHHDDEHADDGEHHDDKHSALKAERAVAEEHHDDEHAEDGEHHDDKHSALKTDRAVAEEHHDDEHAKDSEHHDDKHSGLKADRAVAEEHHDDEHHEDDEHHDDKHSALKAERAVAEEHHDDEHAKDDEHHDDKHSANDHAGQAQWGYGPANGPNLWAALDEDYALCGAGQAQAPVDLNPRKSLALGLDPVDFNYDPIGGVLNKTAQGLRWEVDGKASLTVDGVNYRLEQINFHSPSEHTLGGLPLAGEVQLVHRAQDGRTAIVAVLLERAAEDASLAVELPTLPTKSGKPSKLESSFNLESLLPEDHRAYRYEGSLSTPPCEEGVRWIVFREPSKLKQADLLALREATPNKARPAQPLNGRTLMVDATP